MKRDGTWSVIQTPWAGLVEVLPEGDVVEHRVSPLCACNPRKEVRYCGPDVTSVMFTHNAYDGRE